VIQRRIRERGTEAVFNFSGLERSLPLAPSELPFADDELAPALWGERFRALALGHLGGEPARHDVMLANRLTAATFAVHLTLVRPGDVVVGVSPTYTHPTVLRSAAQVGARFLEAGDVAQLDRVLAREERVSLVVLTRLAVTYDLLPLPAVRRAVELARAKGARVYVDDAGGARVGPAIFDQPKTLALGADLGATGLDKYGTVGPRLGLLGGDRDLIAKIRARAFEFGLEARPMLLPAAVRSLEGYRPERVRTLVATTRRVGEALAGVFGPRLHQTPVTAQLRAEDVLELAMERAGLRTPPIVPIEATAALAMLLLEDHGVVTVHFAGMPPGTSSLLVKFVPPETLERFGGADALAKAVDGSLSKLAGLLATPGAIRELLLGEGQP
jgi:L-seryl-tRNA(Ser) seleniumtransferase